MGERRAELCADLKGVVCGDLSDVDMTPTDPLAEANKNANDLKTLMDNACDFDAQGCNTDPVPQCSACYIHFESCRNKPHFEDDGVTPKEMDIDACMDEVAHTVGGCDTCDSDDSKEAYKVRTLEETYLVEIPINTLILFICFNYNII